MSAPEATSLRDNFLEICRVVSARRKVERVEAIARQGKSIDELRAELAEAERGLDPTFERTDDHSVWVVQRRKHNAVAALRMRIQQMERES